MKSSLLTPLGMLNIKAVIAVAATLLLAASWLMQRTGRGAVGRRPRDWLLAALGLFGALCWWNLGQFHFPGFPHVSDITHYYLGAKYFPELDYTRLYACVAVADQEDGLRGPALERPMRDLATNTRITSAAALDSPERCKRHFSPQRWAGFRHDVRFLRAQVDWRTWNRFQIDHGYNATPTWGVLGRALTSLGPATVTQLRALLLVDTALLLAMWSAVVWGFGWRIACVAAVFWGTHYASPFEWTGGGLLRQDWLAATVIGIALLRRERPAAAGFLLAYATLLRLFPGLVVLGVALGAAGGMLRARHFTLAREQRRFVAGGLLALAVLLPLSALATGGFGSWRAFSDNSRVLLSTPAPNHMGLRTVLSYDPAVRPEQARDPSLADPHAAWKQSRRERFEQRRWIFAALVAGFMLLVARAGAGQPLWLGAVLGVTLIPVAGELAGYYWSVLLALAFAADRKPLMGVALCALAAFGHAVADVWHWADQIHVWLSVLSVAFCVFTVLLLTPRQNPPESTASASGAGGSTPPEPGGTPTRGR